jgi:thiol:disulfide interchange protein DsbD
MRIFQPIFVLPLLLAAGLPALAASSSADAPHVHVQLVVPDGQISGGTAEAGLYFKLEPGWHVYWKNAGDAGEPPHIKWTLPEGITAGPLQFPAPSRLPLGPLMDYGYEDEVLYPLTLNVAKTARPGDLHSRQRGVGGKPENPGGKADGYGGGDAGRGDFQAPDRPPSQAFAAGRESGLSSYEGGFPACR